MHFDKQMHHPFRVFVVKEIIFSKEYGFNNWEI
jgi:hypothetical protein